MPVTFLEHTAPNGLKIIAEVDPEAHSAAAGFFVRTGARDLQSFRTEGVFYEAVTDQIRDDLAKAMRPVWLQVHTSWKGRGGIRSVIRAETGEVPGRYQG
jgi:hypothetical protein